MFQGESIQQEEDGFDFSGFGAGMGFGGGESYEDGVGVYLFSEEVGVEDLSSLLREDGIFDEEMYFEEEVQDKDLFFEQDNVTEIINVDGNDKENIAFQFDVIDGVDGNIKGLSEYGYGFWMKY